MKKSEVPKVADKTFDACKSAGVKKLHVRAAQSYAGLSENKILEVTNKHCKYRKFNVKFWNKAIPRPVRVSSLTEQVTSPNRLNKLIQPKVRVRMKSFQICFIVDGCI